ncbi:MAG: helix-turn-helix domain-containing protein, partial [bacterium]
RIPSLRERREDLPGLIEALLRELRQETGRGPKGFSTQALARLKSYDWPGNLRELRNLLERVCVLGQHEQVQLEDLAGLYESPSPEKGEEGPEVDPMNTLVQVEAKHIRRVLSQTKTLEQAARVLGMTSVTLWRKRKKYGL